MITPAAPAPRDGHPELVSGAEIGRRIGVSRARVSQWAHHPRIDFPRPTGRIGSSLVWRWGDVAAWARRRAGDPSAPAPRAGGSPLRSDELIGRSVELAELVPLLEGGRLLTLTGAPGVGKTRLALEAVRQAEDAFPDGVEVVELASTRDPARVGRAVATVLRLRERQGQAPADAVREHLRNRRALLMLDNCEHLAGGCARLIADVLATCPAVAVVATSQEPLAVGGELVWPVAPLQVPGDGAGPAEIIAADAVQLFCDRAAALRREVRTDQRTLAAVAEICRRLDGIPLAIELAAARLTVLTPTEISRRLDDRFGLLTAGEPALPPRHQTLRGALEWSYGLLPESERAVLQRLSVVAGSCSLDAVSAVCGDHVPGGGAILDVLAGLVAKSLVSADTSGEQARYRLLETVRLYAWERLSESGGTGEARARLARYCVGLAESAEPALTGPEQHAWLQRLDADEGNLRAALAWTVAAGEAACALRLSGALTLFWRVRGRFREGREWLEAALAMDGGAAPLRIRAKALRGLGFMALMLNDGEAAAAALDRSLRMDRRAGDTTGEARSLLLLGNARCLTDLPAAPGLLIESARLARLIGDDWCLAHALGVLAQVRLVEGDERAAEAALDDCLATARTAAEPQSMRLGLYLAGTLALRQGDLRRAEALLAEGLEVTRQLAEPFDIAVALQSLGEVMARRGDHRRAMAMLDEGLALARRTGNANSIVVALCCRADLALQESEPAAARNLYQEALELAVAADLPSDLARAGLGEVLAADGDVSAARSVLEEVVEHDRRHADPRRLARSLPRLAWLNRRAGDPATAAEQQHQALEIQARVGDVGGVAESLEALGGLAAAAGRLDQGARLLAAAETLRTSVGCALPANRRELHEADVAAVASGLGPQRWAEAQRFGAAMTMADAVAYAQRGRGSRARPREGWGSLTRAEARVAELVTAGLSNRQIGERLFISRSTVEGHLSRVFGKLGIESRTQLVRENLRHDGAKNG